MSKPLPRYLAISASDALKVDKAVGESSNNTPTGKFVQPSPVDLRGIPAIGRGVGGATGNSNPLAETIRRDEQRKRKHG